MKTKNLFLGMMIAGIVVGGFSFGYIANALPVDTGGSGIKPDTGGTTAKPEVQTFPRIGNPIKANNITEILYTIVDIAVFVGVIIAVLMFIFIGFKFVLAQGNETELKNARKWFLYAVVGTAILISSKVIVDVIKNTTISAGLVNEKFFNNPTKQK